MPAKPLDRNTDSRRPLRRLPHICLVLHTLAPKNFSPSGADAGRRNAGAPGRQTKSLKRLLD